MGQPWVLAVDLGSGGPKVGAMGLDGELYATSFTPVPTVRTEDGGSVQDVDLWWSGITSSVRGLVSGGVVAGEDLVAVGLTSQYASLVPVGTDGVAVGDCQMWSDHRGRPFSEAAVGGPVSGWAPDVLVNGMRYAGAPALPTGEDQLGHALWIEHGEPEVYARTHVLLEPVDYLGLCFTGRAAATQASMWISGLVDNRPGRALRYVPWLVRRQGRDPSRLPELLPTGSVLGGILPSVARELGVRDGVPVVCGVPDMHAALLGAGTTEDYQVHLAVSTTSWQSCRVPFKRVDLMRLLASLPGIEADSYLVFTDQGSAGFCLRWWMDRLAETSGLVGGRAPDYAEVLGLAATASPGADGLLFVPWLRGERTPVDDRHARAGFINASAHTNLADMSRAVLEGVALNSRWLTTALEGFIGRPVPSMRALGGGIQSDLWCQIYANVLGRPIERVADPMHAQLRGAALLALVGLGEMTLAQASAMVPVSDRFVPEPGCHTVYDPLFSEFTRLHKSLRPHHRRLNATHGT